MNLDCIGALYISVVPDASGAIVLERGTLFKQLQDEKPTYLSGPEHDLPPYEGRPKQTYFICSTGRSGSTLLCSLLNSTGVMGVPHEYLNISRHGKFLIKRLIPDQGQQLTMAGYFDAIVRRRTTSNGIFAVKAHSNQCLPHYKNGFIPRYFGPIKHVLIRRRDTLGQAISLVIANQTGKWTSHEMQNKEPVYSREEIDNALKVTAHYDGLWDQFFAHFKIEPCIVFYEDLLERPTEEIQRVVDFVGVDAKVSVGLESAGLKKESTTLNEAWRTRFSNE